MEPDVGATSRRRRTTPWALLAAVAGLIAASAMVWKASTAAFTATTSNGPNTFSAGTVTITDNDAGAVLFSPGALAPGATGTACIRVTYTGSLDAEVRLYGSGLSATNLMDTHLTLQIEDGGFAGAPPAFPACTGFAASGTVSSGSLNAFGTANASYGNGVGAWTPGGAGQTRDYRFTYTLAANAPNTVQGSSASISFVWEAHST
jgi:hypothetical protein